MFTPVVSRRQSQVQTTLAPKTSFPWFSIKKMIREIRQPSANVQGFELA